MNRKTHVWDDISLYGHWCRQSFITAYHIDSRSSILVMLLRHNFVSTCWQCDFSDQIYFLICRQFCTGEFRYFSNDLRNVYHCFGLFSGTGGANN